MMIHLDVTREQMDVLIDVLETEFRELRGEISNTENWIFKADLKKREEALRKLILAVSREADELTQDIIL